MTRYNDHTIGDIQDDLKHMTSLERRVYSDVERGRERRKMGSGKKNRTRREKEW